MSGERRTVELTDRQWSVLDDALDVMGTRVNSGEVEPWVNYSPEDGLADPAMYRAVLAEVNTAVSARLKGTVYG